MEKPEEESATVERYSCSRCKFHTTSKRQLQHHIRHRHSPGKYVCSECGEKFNRALMYKLHISTHTNKSDHACFTCNKTFPLISMLKIHQETHTTESIHPCPHCSKQFRQKSALSKHVAFGHTKKNVHPCTTCGKIFPSPSTLLLHMDAHKTSAQKTAIDDSAILSRRLRFYQRPNDTKMYKCQRCQRKFFTSYALAKHMEGHHGMQSYKCMQCNLGFKTKKALSEHAAEHVHECDECGKKYRSQEQLESHKKFHNKGAELACSICGRHFSKGTSYRRHMEAHAHNPKYQCTECGKNFRRQADLNTHQWLHKGDGFPCKECGKALGTKQHLIWHSYIHYSVKLAVKTEGDIKQESDAPTDNTDDGKEKEQELKKEPTATADTGTLRKTETTTSNRLSGATSESAILKKSSSVKSTSSKKEGAMPKKSSSSDTATPKKHFLSNFGTPKKYGSESGTPKKQAKKDKLKNFPKRDGQEDKDKKKEKRRTPSPLKKSDSGSSSKAETPRKKSVSKELKVEHEITIKQEKIEDGKSKSANNTPSKSAKKSRKRKSKDRRKFKKSNSNDSGEPTPTDTDSKGITETESATDTQSDKQQMLSTEEVLLSDDVLHDSNELHDAKELRVDTVMFDDIEDDVELDINAAIETLTKLGSHTEHEVATEGLDEVIDEELDQQAATDLHEEELAALEDIGNIETADKEISHADIQTLYDMETDNDTGAETEGDAAAKATAAKATAAAVTGVFCTLPTNRLQAAATQQQLEAAVCHAGDVITDSSAAAMLIESEIVTQADRLIETGLYVQNVMGGPECTETVLAALDSAVHTQTLTSVEQDLLQDAADKANSSSAHIAATNITVVHTEPAPPPTVSPMKDLLPLTGTNTATMVITLQPTDTIAAAAPEPHNDTQHPLTIPVKNKDTANLTEAGTSDNIATASLQVAESKSSPVIHTDNRPVTPVVEEKQVKETGTPSTDSKHAPSTETSTVPVDHEEETTDNTQQIKCISGSYVASVETVTKISVSDNLGAVSSDNSSVSKTPTDTVVNCTHSDRGSVKGQNLPCLSGCAKCSTEFGLSINKTVCPHSKELKVLVEKLDIKAPVVDNSEVTVCATNRAAESAPAVKRKRVASSELEALLLEKKPVPDNQIERTPNSKVSPTGSSRLRRRVHHSSGSKSVSTKCCDTRKKESHLYTEYTVSTPAEQDDTSPRVTTRSSNARGVRSLRTGAPPMKEWRKISPHRDKKHAKKFSSVPRRKSDSDQMSPPPQYKVSTLNDLTIRITTQSSPETSPPRQKRCPSYKDVSLKSSRGQDKEDGILRQAHGANQELCVVLDDINELVLLQQERLQKMKGFRSVKLGNREEQKRQQKSGNLASEIEGPQKPIKIFLRLPKDRIRKHERSLSQYDKHLKYNSSDGVVNEYQQPDSSQDMQREKLKHRDGHRSRVRSSDSAAVNDKESPDELPTEEWAEDGSATHRVIGSVISVNNSVLSVEECDSTSMSETQRHASSTSGTGSRTSQGTKCKSGTASSKCTSPNKDTTAQHQVVEPLDLTVKYKDFSDTEVKADPEQELDPMDVNTDVEYCTCDDSACKEHPGHSPHKTPIKVEEGEAPAASATSTGTYPALVHETGANPRHHEYVNSPNAQTAASEAGVGEDGQLTEFIEVIDRGIQCELGDELLFMPDVPQQAVD